ncbi:transglutaminase-like domain-containing protein [Flavihumibacter solisilvae]|uniref:Transglutaminase-like domain-containing protein n=1 Tax=Flavihumibacter solisilvae TaxID=1349421 RepID=A0A0C1LEF5_9BACT|nr:transglutaminase-like domain-containing protein [Flavihumibacter solisilvae]KIC93803.1 hypothetical protein OI18_15685 [Flavihumibacter solisilvae]
MKKTALSLFLLLSVTRLFSQLQTSDSEGATQATALKKISKKAKYGAHLISQEFSFNTGKGLDGATVVTARENSSIEMVSMDNKAYMGYLVPYNNFVQVKDYDFEVFYKNKFRSQKYAPQKVSLTDDAIFFDDSFGQFYGMNAEESGQRCRFTYDYIFSDAKYLTRVFFHENMPVKEHRISFKVPSWLELQIMEKNFDSQYKIKKETRKEDGFTVYTYTAQNMQAVRQEPVSLSRPYYLPHLIVTVRSFTINGKKQNGFTKVDDMYAWYNYLYKKANNDIASLKPLVAQLTQGKANDMEKIRSIYYWVQDNIRYIAFEEGYSGFIPHTVQDVFKNKYGDCKGMANLLTEMMKIAGFDAHFAWIGTREIPYDRREVLSLCVDNHAISVLYHQGNTYFLDGTEKYAPLGKNAYRIQGKNVLVQDGDNFRLETVPSAKPEDNNLATTVRMKLNGDKLTGHVKLTYNGEAKNFFHYIYNRIPANKRSEFIKRLVELNISSAEVSNVKNSDFADRDLPIVIEGDVEISNRVTIVDKICYTSMDFYTSTFGGFVPDEERQNPIDLDHVFFATDEVVLELPANAKANGIPQAFTAAFSKNNMEASYAIEKNTIVLKKKMQLNSPVIRNNEFTDWKNFLAKIREFNRNNISIQLQ